MIALPGLLAPERAAGLARAAAALPFERMETDLVRADRRLLASGELPEWRSFLAADETRERFGARLGRDLPPGLVVNVWRMRAGDAIGPHPDGPLYRGTLTLGLNPGWTAADGGAIAFGEPGPDGLRVRERWLPLAGDGLLFAPGEASWHAVEPVAPGRTRLTVTAWWVAPEHAL